MSCFGTGNFEHFFSLWNSNVPEKIQKEDLECQKLEFNLHLHFAVFSLVHNIGKVVSTFILFVYFTVAFLDGGSTSLSGHSENVRGVEAKQ